VTLFGLQTLEIAVVIIYNNHHLLIVNILYTGFTSENAFNLNDDVCIFKGIKYYVITLFTYNQPTNCIMKVFKIQQVTFSYYLLSVSTLILLLKLGFSNPCSKLFLISV